MKKCPFCAEEIQDQARVCRYCGRELEGGKPGVSVQVEIDRLKDERTRKEAALSSARSQRAAGLAAVLIGILCAVFLGTFGLILGGLLFVAGALAAVTQAIKVSSYQGELAKLEETIEYQRKRMSGA